MPLTNSPPPDDEASPNLSDNVLDQSSSQNPPLLFAPNNPQNAAGNDKGIKKSEARNSSTSEQAMTEEGDEQSSTRAHAPSTIASQGETSRWTPSLTRPNPRFNPEIDPVVNPDIEDADVWEKYITVVAESDKLSIDGWNQDMDVILIFAGLFSAVLTAFIIEFSRLLKPEQDDISAQLLVDISLVLRASAQGLPIPEPFANLTALEYDFKVPNYIVWVNSLWFSSLICSLGVAISVMVVKQWFQYYRPNVNRGDSRTDARHRQYRHNAFLRWKVPRIVSSIPLLMHLSVGLFFAGLVVLLRNINIDVAYVVLVLVVVFYFCYFFTTLLPLFSTSCPYKSSALTLLQDSFLGAIVAFWSIIYRICRVFDLSSKDITLAKMRFILGWKKLGIGLVGRITSWLRALNEGANNFFASPPRFAKRHLDEAERGEDKSKEELMIEQAQNKLDIDSILWLVSASGKQNLVDLGLACISQLKPEPDLIHDCLRYNIQYLLTDRSTIPLPNPNHDFWQKLDRATPSDSLSRKDEARIPVIQSFLHSLMFLWHHPAYYDDDDPPPAISTSLVWDRQTEFAGNQRARKLRISETGAEESTQHPPHLLGDWLMFWRALVKQNDDYQSIADRGWSLDFFADIICVETHYFHLTHRDVDGPLVRDDSSGMEPWSDLCNLIGDYTLGGLQVLDRTLGRILDTYIYVVSSTQQLEIHLLLGLDVLLALLRLLKHRKMTFDNILPKLVLSLQLFTMDGSKKKQQGKAYYQNDELRITRNTIFQQLSTVLSILINTYNQRPATPADSMTSNTSPEVVRLSSVLLYMTQLEIDNPSRTHDNLFATALPIDAASDVIQFISTLPLHQWRTPETLFWVVELLCNWVARSNANLDQQNREKIVDILAELLRYAWTDISDTALPNLCDMILPIFKQFLQSSESDVQMAQKVSDESCHSLRSMFQRIGGGNGPAPLLEEYVNQRLFSAIAAFLSSGTASPQSRHEWGHVRRMWRQKRRRDAPEERDEYDQLYAQTHSGETPDHTTPLLIPQSVEAGTSTSEGAVTI